MTRKQYENLKVGDLVTRTGGPNKDIPVRVTKKYITGGKNLCLSVEVVDENTYLYEHNPAKRDGRHTWGAASCFKILK